jgi:hypothetical protein
MLTCDVCGNAKDVQTWTFGLDGKTYEVDLCPKDGKGLSRVTAGYASNARKVSAGHSQRHNGHRASPKAATAGVHDGAGAGVKTSGRGRATGSTRKQSNTSRSEPQAAKVSGPKAKAAGSGEGKASRPRPR